MSSLTPSMIAASKPMPAITMKWVSSNPSPLTSTMSMARSWPVSATSMAARMYSGMSRLRASRLPVPAGTMPTGMPVPASSAQTSRTVPSPPQTSTRSAPSMDGLLGHAGAGVLDGRVDASAEADQPASAAIAVTIALNASTSSTLIGLRMTARLRLLGVGVGSSGSERIEWLTGRGEYAARPSMTNPAPSRAPPTTSLGKCRPRRTRSRHTTTTITTRPA